MEITVSKLVNIPPVSKRMSQEGGTHFPQDTFLSPERRSDKAQTNKTHTHERINVRMKVFTDESL